MRLVCNGVLTSLIILACAEVAGAASIIRQSASPIQITQCSISLKRMPSLSGFHLWREIDQIRIKNVSEHVVTNAYIALFSVNGLGDAIKGDTVEMGVVGGRAIAPGANAVPFSVVEKTNASIGSPDDIVRSKTEGFVCAVVRVFGKNLAWEDEAIRVRMGIGQALYGDP